MEQYSSRKLYKSDGNVTLNMQSKGKQQENSR